MRLRSWGLPTPDVAITDDSKTNTEAREGRGLYWTVILEWSSLNRGGVLWQQLSAICPDSLPGQLYTNLNGTKLTWPQKWLIRPHPYRVNSLYSLPVSLNWWDWTDWLDKKWNIFKKPKWVSLLWCAARYWNIDISDTRALCSKID